MGGLSFGALFLGIGIGLRDGALGDFAIVLGLAGVAAAVISLFLNLQIDRQRANDGKLEAVRYPSFAGFELEDGIYLLAPITWLGLLSPFFVAASIGAAAYSVWTFWTLLRHRPASG